MLRHFSSYILTPIRVKKFWMVQVLNRLSMENCATAYEWMNLIWLLHETDLSHIKCQFAFSLNLFFYGKNCCETEFLYDKCNEAPAPQNIPNSFMREWRWRRWRWQWQLRLFCQFAQLFFQLFSQFNFFHDRILFQLNYRF